LPALADVERDALRSLVASRGGAIASSLLARPDPSLNESSVSDLRPTLTRTWEIPKSDTRARIEP
jgi:hypothetical protein